MIQRISKETSISRSKVEATVKRLKESGKLERMVGIGSCSDPSKEGPLNSNIVQVAAAFSRHDKAGRAGDRKFSKG